MHFVAHRGNTNGPSRWENHPDRIDELTRSEIASEVDVWVKGNAVYFGHDAPKYEVSSKRLEPFLFGDVIFHAKNLEALYHLVNLQQSGFVWAHFFYHQNDDFALTSQGYIWTYPGKLVTPMSILVDLEKKDKYPRCYAICGDYCFKSDKQ